MKNVYTKPELNIALFEAQSDIMLSSVNADQTATTGTLTTKTWSGINF